MQKLHLVGFTTDHEGLILSARRGARSGGYVLALDDALEEAIDELREQRAEAEADDDEAARAPRIESNLPVREIQARLRQGRSIAEVAKVAGVDPAWVERFAAPILAERGRVISKVRVSALRRARLGQSAQPIGDAVRHHVADRGLALTADEFDEAWTARQLADGRWAVRFTFHYRGRNQTLQFDLDESSGSVNAADRLSGQLGYIAPKVSPSAKTRKATSAATTKPRPTVKRAVVSTGFRRDVPAGKPASRSAKERERAAAAMRKAAAQRAVEAERAAARRTRERAAAARKKEREDKARAAQAERDRRQRAAAKAAKAREAAAKKAVAKKAVAKKAATKKAAAKKAAAKKAATKKAATKKAAAKKAVSKKQAPLKRASSQQASPKKAASKKAASKKATSKKATKQQATATHQVAIRSAASAAPRPPVTAPQTIRTVSPRPVITAESRPTIAPTPRPRPASAPVRAVETPPSPTPAVAPRPQFRVGLVESAAEARAIEEQLAARRALAEAANPRPPVDSANGAAPSPSRPPADRPRRTRPLRAT